MPKTLIEEARKALKNAYVPYSQFQVGAAVKMKSGKIYTGCNIENASFSLTCCAERIAMFKAVSHGETDFVAIAVIALTDGPISPCGACRQVMAEFFTDETKIYITNDQADLHETNLPAVLPFHFKL